MIFLHIGPDRQMVMAGSPKIPQVRPSQHLAVLLDSRANLL